jgi:hypothetical protein
MEVAIRRTEMTRMIDVTGLPPEAIRAMEPLVALLRNQAAAPPRQPSTFDVVGKAARTRDGEDIARQIQEGHDSWGAP